MKNKITLIVTGSVAAFKAQELTSTLTKKGYDVHIVLSKGALNFVLPSTFEALSKNKVHTNDEYVFNDKGEYKIPHIDLAQNTDLVLVVPASANIIGKIANGIADDFVSTLMLAVNKKIMIAPAMNDFMWDNFAVKRNIEILKQNNIDIIDPCVGKLVCGNNGKGKLADINDIANYVDNFFELKKKLLNKNVLISLGRTQEEIDPVRYISNHSSGKMGYALAKAFKAMGANVSLVAGKVDFKINEEFFKVDYAISAKDMLSKMLLNSVNQDYIVQVAAISDFTVKKKEQKIKKEINDKLILELERTEDVLKAISSSIDHSKTKIIGFAAETNNWEENAIKKIKNKNLDFIILNDVSRKDIAFSNDDNEVVIINSKGEKKFLAKENKETLAIKIVEEIIK